MHKAQEGRSLVEMTISLALGAVVVTGLAGGCVRLLTDFRVSAATNDLVHDIERAKQHALLRNLPVGMCASDDGKRCAPGGDWSNGWIVYAKARTNTDRRYQPGVDTLLFATAHTSSVRVQWHGTAQAEEPVQIQAINGSWLRIDTPGSFSVNAPPLTVGGYEIATRCVVLRHGVGAASYKAKDAHTPCSTAAVAERSGNGTT